MTVVDLMKAFAQELSVGFVLTNASFEGGGPKILYVNPAMERLTGYKASALVGNSPRMLQGKATSPFTRRIMGQALREGLSFHTCVTNYRAGGESYLCELDIRPLSDERGRVEHFIAFEREVVRRRVRARGGVNNRFRPVDPATEAEAAGILAASGCFASQFD